MQKLAYAEGRLQGWGKGDKNPSKRKEVKDGKKSIFSMNYIGYDGMSDEEKKLKISQVLKECAEKKKRRGNLKFQSMRNGVTRWTSPWKKERKKAMTPC